MGNELLEPEKENELLQPDEIAKMNHPFDVEGIKREMKKLLDKPKCSAFVKRLLELVGEKAAPGNKLVENGDVLKIFDMVLKQKGLVRAGDKANGAISGGSFASGSIKNGDARIQIGIIRPGKAMTRAEAAKEYLRNDTWYCLHETLHHASELGYSDQDYAIAASIINGNKPELPSTDNRFTLSVYWDDDLRKTFV